MSPVSGLFLLLLGAIVSTCALSGRSHRLHYFFTGVSEPGGGLPHFSIVGYLDDEQFVRYDSETRRDLPRSSWIQKMEEHDAQYWDWQTQLSRSWELYFRVSLWTRFNHSRGHHTWQWMHGCEVSADGRKGGLSQFGYDGRDFLSLDKETLTWTASNPKAQVTKRKWEADRVWTQGRKTFLEEDCIDWLHKYLNYGKETLLRKEPPVVKVTRKASYGDLETLLCRAHGFYPKEIDITWRMEGNVMEQETRRGGIAPNADGTYHTWLSIEVDTKDRDLYRCHVEHDSLPEPLDVTWEEAGVLWPLMAGISGAVAVVILLGVILVLYLKRWREGYRATAKLGSTPLIEGEMLEEKGGVGHKLVLNQFPPAAWQARQGSPLSLSFSFLVRLGLGSSSSLALADWRPDGVIRGRNRVKPRMMAPMGPLWGLLGVAVPLLMEVGLGGSPSHSLSYLFTVVSEPGPGLPQFMVSGHFDGQLFAFYDSERRSGVPRTEWMVEMDPGYWDWLNRNARNAEQIFKWQMGTVMRHYNHSGGLHTMQWVFSCTLSEDGLKGGSNKFSYDGREALSFDKETLRWTASDSVAEGYKEKWETEAGRTQRSKVYLEEKCISMLRKHLEVGKEAARKRVAPSVKVTHKPDIGGLETLVCHIHGFYPKDIDATWRKDEEVQEQETLRGNVIPNSDGTYNTWISIEVDTEDRDKYQCHVEHDSLPEGPGSDLQVEICGTSILPWIIVGSVLAFILILVLVFIIHKMRGSQNPPATNAERQEMNPPQKRRRICSSDAE
ncbi:uncharacterized protein [Anolis sagrei]|uniref:uncharacterized protein n=1 Tax=Anolis sagrei TaxID=38937 RepID=UPI0035210473